MTGILWKRPPLPLEQASHQPAESLPVTTKDGAVGGVPSFPADTDQAYSRTADPRNESDTGRYCREKGDVGMMDLPHASPLQHDGLPFADLHNPFVSEVQRRFMYVNEPAIAKRWEAETPDKKLPFRKQ